MFSNYQWEAKELDRALSALFVVGDGSADRAKTLLRNPSVLDRLRLDGQLLVVDAPMEEYNV